MIPRLLQGVSLVFLLLAGTAKASTVSDSHIQQNIRLSLESADAVAVVRVSAVKGGGRLQLHVDEVVLGELKAAQVLTASAGAFVAADREPGTKLLVFLRRSGGHKFQPTGHYELILNGTIREIPTADYLAAVRAQGAKLLEERSASRARLRGAQAQRPVRSTTVASRSAGSSAHVVP